MKNFLFIVLSLLSLNMLGQTIKYSDLKTFDKKYRGTYEKYISKNGETYSVGDTIAIGTPSGTNGRFVYIYSVYIGTISAVGPEAANTYTEIKKIWANGSKRSGMKVSFQTKGPTGLENYSFHIEDAIASGEVKTKGMSSDQALSDLKRAKDKLDLGLITKEEYDKIKEKLRKYIK